MRRTLAIALILAAMTVGAQARFVPVVGDRAPSIDAPGVTYVARDADADTSRPMLLVFAKSDDAHTSDAIRSVRELYGRYPRLARESRTVVVLCRVDVGTRRALPELDPTWSLALDEQDKLYESFGIVATPTSIMLAPDGTIVGIHRGYDPALADSVRSGLTRAIDGDVEATVSPTPGIMSIQMGRTMVRRGLWEKAQAYYEKAASEGAREPEFIIEHAEVLVEMGEAERALALLDSLPEAVRAGENAKRVRERATGSSTTPAKPPAIP